MSHCAGAAYTAAHAPRSDHRVFSGERRVRRGDDRRPRRRVHDGRHGGRARRGAAPRHRRPVPPDAPRGDQPRIPGVRRGDRSQDRPGEARRGATCGRTGGGWCAAPSGAGRTGRARASTGKAITRSSRCRSATRPPIAPGPGCGCPARRSGSSPPAAPTGADIPGATTRRRRPARAAPISARCRAARPTPPTGSSRSARSGAIRPARRRSG